MTAENDPKVLVGVCASCGRQLRLKPRGLSANLRLTCKCGHLNLLQIDDEILIQYGVKRLPVQEDIYRSAGVPLFRLLDGPRLQALWAQAEAKQAQRIQETREQYFKDKPMPQELLNTLSALPDMISVAINPYASQPSARQALGVLVERVKRERQARPWSLELYENVQGSIYGLLDAPYYIFIGMAGEQVFERFKRLVHNLHSDYPRIGAGAEWEISSQGRGNQWRGDRCARLLERWVFLDEDVIQTFGV